MLKGTNFKIIDDEYVFDNGKYKFTLNIGWVYPRFSIPYDCEWTREIALALNRLFNEITLE